MDSRTIKYPHSDFALFRMARTACFFLLISLLAPFTVSAIDTEKAELLFESGRYALAKTHFQKAVEQRPHPSLHYNLALIELKLNELASARWQIEQARMMAPMQSKYRLLEAHILEQLELSAHKAPLVKIVRFLSVSQWSWIASVAAWACVWLVIVGIYRYPSPVRTIILCSALLSLIGLSLYARNQQMARLSSAIVCAKSPVELLSAPAKNVPQLGSVAYGERLRVLNQHLDYIQVLGPNDVTGWLSKSQLRMFPSLSSQPIAETARPVTNQR